MRNIMKKYLVIIIGYGLLLIVMFGCNQHNENNFNEAASISSADDLPVNPLLEKVITTTIHPADSTMSTLYANDIAWNYASSHNDFNYPEGAELYEVTWRQKPDKVWFGANIPEEIIRVECLTFSDVELPTYTCYRGRPLKKAVSNNPSYEGRRIKEIESQRMAVAP
jgi:hypothetical protein